VTKSDDFADDELNGTVNQQIPDEMRHVDDILLDGHKSESTHNLLKSTIIIKRTILLSIFILPPIMFLYYVTLWATGVLSGNLYINGIINGVTEFSATALAILLTRCGSRFLLTSALGLSCILGAIISFSTTAVATGCFWTLRIVLVIGYATAFNYMIELYPTKIRAMYSGMIMVPGRAFSFVAPYLKSMPKTNPTIFWGIVVVMCGIGVLVLLFMPETKQVRLPESMKDLKEQESTRIIKCRQ